MKILVAVDGSEYSQRTLEFLDKQGWLSKANELTVLTVVLPFPHRAAAFADPVQVQKYYDEDAQAILREVRDWLGQRDVAVTFAHEIGNPAECIARRATTGHFDLIAMGSHGHGALGSLVPGSVAVKVLAACKTPILLIR